MEVPILVELLFYSSRRVIINKNRFFDSNPKPSDGYDRYAIVFGIGAQVSDDIWITENLIEHLQVEIDNARRVHIVHNRSIKPKYTLGFGWASGGLRAVCEDWVIEGNVVIDPIIYGIGICLDGFRDGSIIRNVLIADNIIIYRERRYQEPRVLHSRAIMVGSRPEERVIAKGVVWESIAIRDNQVVYERTLPFPVVFPAIQVTAVSEHEQMSKILISGNMVIGNGKLESWGIETAYLTNSHIRGNAIYGAKGGILLRERIARNLVEGNLVADVLGSAYRFENSGGDNRAVNNSVFGKVGKPFKLINLQSSDRIESK